MTRTDVLKLYTRFGGRWWDPFRDVWEFLTCRQAVADLNSLVRRYVTPDTKVLDVACGTGHNLDRLLNLGVPFGQYTGVDFSTDMLALARKNFPNVPNTQFVQADATALPDTGERYNVIIATWLLDHLHQPAEFVNSVQRFLEPGGHLLLFFYSEPKPFVGFWLSPLGRFSVLANPVPAREVSKFENVLTRKSYSAGVATVIDIAPGAEAAPE